jgi:dihydrofolate reductase
VCIKASVFIATSLDGFIARANGDLDWLTGDQSASNEQDYGYQEFMDTVDTIVLGRNTFELVLTFDAWPYSGKKVVVLSSRPNAIPPHLADDVDGGKTIQGFLDAGLIEELTITRVPILIGTGVPLFGPPNHDVRLTHIATRQFENGFVQSKYRVADTV